MIPNDSINIAAVVVVAVLISYLTYLVVQANNLARRHRQRPDEEGGGDDNGGGVPRIVTVEAADAPARINFENTSQYLSGPFVSFVEIVSNSILQRFVTFLGFSEVGDALRQQQSGSKLNRVINIIQVLCVVVMWFVVSKIITHFF